MIKVAFHLMNEKGYYVLNYFLKEFSADNIEYVVISEDKGVENDYYKELVDLCDKFSIKYFNRGELAPVFNGYKFAIGWRWMIKNPTRLIVLHDSILPKYRGFSPLVNMLVNGETDIGVTALFASTEYDKGDIIKQEQISIKYPIKIQEAIIKMAPLYSKIINSICELIFSNKHILAEPQNEEDSTHSLWRDEQDYFINWKNDAKYIRRQIDAVGYPFKGARTYLNHQLIIIDEAEVCEDLKIENRDTGKVIFVKNGYPIVVCGKGLIKITVARDLKGSTILPLNKFRSRFEGKV